MMRVVVVAAAFAAVLAAALGPAPAGAQPSVQHWDSEAGDGVFLETFILHHAEPDGIQVMVDGATIPVAWEGQAFSFSQEAFDVPRLMVLEKQKQVLWSGTFGGGGGTPIAWDA